MCAFYARAKFHGHELTDIPVLNPGDSFGKTWLIEIGGSYIPFFLVVEADSASDAIDELSDNDAYGHLITVSEENLADYDPENCHFGPSGQVLDLDWLSIHGVEGTACPFACRYYGDGLPDEGVSPEEFCNRDDD